MVLKVVKNHLGRFYPEIGMIGTDFNNSDYEYNNELERPKFRITF